MRPFERPRVLFKRTQKNVAFFCTFEKNASSFKRARVLSKDMHSFEKNVHSFKKNARSFEKNAHSFERMRILFKRMQHSFGSHKVQKIQKRNVAFLKRKRMLRSFPFFCKERKRTEHSFAKNVKECKERNILFAKNV